MSYLPTGPKSDCSPRNPAVRPGIRLHCEACISGRCQSGCDMCSPAQDDSVRNPVQCVEKSTGCNAEKSRYCIRDSRFPHCMLVLPRLHWCVLPCLRRSSLLQHASCNKIILEMSKNMCKAQDVHNVCIANSISHRCSATVIRTKQSPTY
jgi:hypothetical protein